jgi:hypothetical protein
MLSMGTLLLPVVERTVPKLAAVCVSRVPFCSSIQDIMAPLLHLWLTSVVVVMYSTSNSLTNLERHSSYVLFVIAKQEVCYFEEGIFSM